MTEHAPQEEAPQGHPLLRALFAYGIGAFAIGFVLGVLRELVFVPLLGQRPAHWAEFPILIALILLLARRVLRGKAEWTAWRLLAIGAGGVAILLALESTFALYVVNVPLEKYLASFDIREGALFPLGLAIMLVGPLLLVRFRKSSP